MLIALVGRHADSVVDHPALTHRGLIITWAGNNGPIGAPIGFSVLVEMVVIEIPD